jgi:hypothetical protein
VLTEPMAAFTRRLTLPDPRVHAGKAPVPMAAPDRRKKQAAWIWAKLRDDLSFGGRDRSQLAERRFALPSWRLWYRTKS